jgi:hypothetical protein
LEAYAYDEYPQHWAPPLTGEEGLRRIVGGSVGLLLKGEAEGEQENQGRRQYHQPYCP